jgi:phosphoglycolate phosphatase
MTSHNFDAILFDLDGTLVDTLGDFVAALNGMFTDVFAHVHLQDFKGQTPKIETQDVTLMVGKGSEHLVQQALKWAQTTTPMLPSVDLLSLNTFALARYLDHYANLNGLASVLYPGVEACLQHWHLAGVPMVCLTNKPERFARELLAQKKCLAYFKAVVGGDTFEKKKPHPLPLIKACELLQTSPQRTLMVGDSVNDVQAARAAQCPVYLVSYGYNHGQPAHTASADRVIDSLEELR